MDPVCPSGWKAEQKEFAEWSDDSSSESSLTSSTTTTTTFTDLDEDDEDENENFSQVTSYGYFKLVQLKKVYKIILEEEDLIK